MIRTLWIVLLLIAPRQGWAHQPSDALLRVQIAGSTLSLRWEVSLRDLAVSPGGIGTGDATLQRDQLLAQQAVLFELLRAHVRFHAGGVACTLQASEPPQRTEHSGGNYAALAAVARCARAGQLVLDYDYLFASDPQHRLIARIGDETHVLSSERRRVELALHAPARASNLLASGLGHILEGTDHLLFLLALLLPAVLARKKRARVPADSLRPVLGEVLRVVTAFTVAHSTTLSLAVLGVASLPVRLVEPAIAASVIVAAVLNLVPPRESRWLGGARWPVAYTLGLLHGFGFSSALDDVGLDGTSVIVPLVTFNLGVEIGQLAVVALLLPLLYLARRWSRYESLVLRGGSTAVALIASGWFVERAFDVTLLL